MTYTNLTAMASQEYFVMVQDKRRLRQHHHQKHAVYQQSAGQQLVTTENSVPNVLVLQPYYLSSLLFNFGLNSSSVRRGTEASNAGNLVK
jgi:hypothetical protein